MFVYHFINAIYDSWIVQIPSQQSALLAQLLPSDEKSLWQLSFPQVNLPAQSESASQSPSPILHCLEDEQQLQSVVGTPLHFPGGGMEGVVCAPITITWHIVEVYCLLKLYSQLRKSKLNTIPSQQSAVLSQLLPEVEKSLWQLLVPHLRPELHCVSESQSPPPTAHFFWLVQQPQFVMGTPSQDPDGGGAAVDMMLSRKYIQY